MRTMYRYIIRLILLAFVCITTATGSYAQGGTAPVWTDSLYVFITDSVVVNNALEFKIKIFRPNSNWNNADTVLGDVDFYFNFNHDAFSGTPTFVSVHDSIDMNGSLSDPRRLHGTITVWAERLRIAFREKEGEEPNVIRIPYRDTLELCHVRWNLKQPPRAILDILWDRPATGMMTDGGNPIIDTLIGTIIKNPDPSIRIIKQSDEVWVCENEPAELIVKAESSGKGLRYIWADSIAGSRWQTIDTVGVGHAPVFAKTHRDYVCDIKGKGDTLYIYNVPGSMDSIYFRCVAEDSTINKRMMSATMQILVRDSISAFLSHDKNTLLADQVDTVTKCPGVDVNIRFNLFGLQQKELGELDTVYCRYLYWKDNINPFYDTVVVAGNKMLPYDPEVKINGEPLFYTTLSVADVGKYYIDKVWTTYCSNGSVSPRYDSVYVKDGTQANLPRMLASVGDGEITVDTSFTKLGGIPESIVNTNFKLGEVRYVYQTDAQVKYFVNDSIPGVDTLVYTMEGGGCELLREIEIIDKKYLSIKVLLGGPYIKKQVQDSMRCFNPVDFPTKQGFYVSPYHSNLRLAEIPVLKKGTIADWIHVKLRDGEAGDYVDSASVFLRSDGVLCDTAGHPYIGFASKPGRKLKDAYFIVIEHRNHIGVMSKDEITLTASPISSGVSNGANGTSADFTIYTNVYGSDRGANVMQKLETAGGRDAWGLWAGYIIDKFGGDVTVRDKNAVFIDYKANVMGYVRTDLTFDAWVTPIDYAIIDVAYRIRAVKQY